MSFRKRGIVIPQSGAAHPAIPAINPNSQIPTINKQPPPGTRPSPLDGRLTTSTGTRSLDALLAGHSGLALGTSILIEESGTTDFGGTLLKYYVAEGVVQKHVIHVLGLPEGWGRELPGLGKGEEDKEKKKMVDEEKMKIAWRYERLGEFGTGGLRERNAPQSTSSSTNSSMIFCHDFDLSKRLILPSPSNIHFIPLTSTPDLSFQGPNTALSPFTKFLNHLTAQLTTTLPTTIHRVVIPNLLSTAIYPPHASSPTHSLQFLHALRALLRTYPTQLTVLITLPLTLYPRTTGLTKWIELLSDGVMELLPFPSTSLPKAPPTTFLSSNTATEEEPQGIVKLHRLPIFHEKGGGNDISGGSGNDLAFSLSRRKGMVVKPYSLPPVEWGSNSSKDEEGGLDIGEGKKAAKDDIEF